MSTVHSWGDDAMTQLLGSNRYQEDEKTIA